MKIDIKNKDVYIIIILIILLILTKVGVFQKNKSIDVLIDDKKSEVNLEVKKDIKVDISGAIKNPGVYTLLEDDRLEKLIKKSGGLKKDANRDNINLARKLKDGIKIYIPYKEDSEKNVSTDKFTLTQFNNFNQKQLETIDGIGEVIAHRIIEYIEKNGPFKSVNEIQKVNGIGSSKLKIIRNFIY